MDFKKVFKISIDYLKEKNDMGDIPFHLWIECISPVSLDGEIAVVSVPTDFQKNIVETRYTGMLLDAFNAVLGFEVGLKVISIESDKPQNALFIEPEHLSFSKEEMDQNSKGGDYEYTFDTFIVGSSNKFAHAACVSVAENPSGIYNPLFIYGGSGLGKTHLLYAIENRMKEKFPDYKILYVKGEDFTNELIDALGVKNAAKENNTHYFHEKYRNVDVLLVDDIQFIAGKEATQEEFFHTFDALFHSGKQIVLTSDRPTSEIKTLEDRLKTRFEWGLTADIQRPEFETRVAIIKRKAELMNIDIPNDVCEFIANKLKNNIRQLEGTVKKMKAYQQLAGSQPTISLAQTAIKDILNDNQPVPVTVERIINEVARTFSISAQDIRSPKHSAAISSARQTAAYIVREITQMPLTQIGEEFGGRDHATMVYAIKKVLSKMDKDFSYRETVEDIIKNIRDN